MWSGQKLTNTQASSKPEDIWPEVWSNTSKQFQQKEKTVRSKERPKLDKAREEFIVFLWKTWYSKKISRTREKMNRMWNQLRLANRKKQIENTVSWVVISRGSDRYVTPLSEEETQTQRVRLQLHRRFLKIRSPGNQRRTS